MLMTTWNTEMTVEINKRGKEELSWMHQRGHGVIMDASKRTWWGEGSTRLGIGNSRDNLGFISSYVV